jgi:precorrin-4 C11-methyltransferase
MKTQGKVIFVGAGPGAPDLITLRGQEAIAAADLIVYAGSLVPREVLTWAKPTARIVDSAPLTLDHIHRLMVEAVHNGHVVARVHTGDPALYGTLGEQTQLLDAEHIPWEVVPGVSAAFAAAAAAKVSFTHPGGPQTLILTRLPGRTPMPESEDLATLARSHASLAVYLSAPKAPELAQALRAAGLAPETPIIIAIQVGHPTERIIRTTLAHLEADARALTRQALFLVLPHPKTPRTSCLYHPDFSHGFRRAQSPEHLAIYSLTRRGIQLARRIAAALPATIFVPNRLHEPGLQGFPRLRTAVAENWSLYPAHVVVGATGIAVRAIAPRLAGKTHDPAVVVCDPTGRFAISLAGGHIAGANNLARTISRLIGATPVITTASDLLEVPAIDLLAQASNLAIGNPQALPRLQGKWLEGIPLKLHDPATWLHLPPSARSLTVPVADPHGADIVVGPESADTEALTLHPPCLAVGIGCRRGVPRDYILEAIRATLQSHNLAMASLAFLTTIEAKAQETGILEAAADLGVAVHLMPAALLKDTAVPTPSLRVQHFMGVASVCEAAALASHPQAMLRVLKQIHGPVTVAVAQLPSGWWGSDPGTPPSCPPSPGKPSTTLKPL